MPASKLDPLKPMMIGMGPVAPLGIVTGTLKSIIFPESSTCTLMAVALTEPVTVAGLSGFAP